MPTTTEPRVDVGALAGEIVNDVQRRVATAVVLTIDHLEEDDNALNQLQKIMLVDRALSDVDGLEAGVVRTLVDKLTRNGVSTFGLDESHG